MLCDHVCTLSISAAWLLLNSSSFLSILKPPPPPPPFFWWNSALDAIRTCWGTIKNCSVVLYVTIFLIKVNNLDASCSHVVDSMYWCQCCSCCVILFVPFGPWVHGQTPWKYKWCKDEGDRWSTEPPDLCILFESLSMRKEGEGNYRMGASEL